MANLTNFYISVNLSGSVANPVNSSTFQIVTPWGQTSACYSWEEAVNQAFFRNSRVSGRMGQYFNSQTTNGLTTGSQTVPTTANDIIGSP
jgi:hypothetical protein